MKKLLKKYCAYLSILALTTHTLQPCSIVGYVGFELCKEFIKEGLSRLEYRGYDSAGFACFDESAQNIAIIRAEGKLQALKDKLDKDPRNGVIGIGHTRWATHGPATEYNAHPHTNCDGSVVIVHNGIIDNYYSLKQQLITEKCGFSSDTDSEVIAHLLKTCIETTPSMKEAIVAVVNQLQGTFGCIAMLQDKPDTLIAMRKGSPICIGAGQGEMFIASDFLAFAGKTNQVIFMPNESFAIITKDSVQLYDFKGNAISAVVQTMDVKPSAYEKLGHEHFMLKEIYEQRRAIHDCVNYYRSLGSDIWKQLGLTPEQAKNLKRVHLFGCGTSWHAARIAQFFFEVVCHIPTYIYLASEFRYMPFFPEEGSLYIAVSQSGETADTLEAVRLIKQHNQPVITVTNVATSNMVRETGGALLLKAGPEIAVASTKAFTTQVSALYWLAHYLAFEKGIITVADLQKAEEDLLAVAHVLEDTIDKYKIDIIQNHAKRYAQAKRFMFLGRHVGYPFAMEAALKLKEISYIFAQGYPAGELKHGSIALIDLETPVMMFSHLDPVIYSKLIANAQEVKARKGHLIAVAFEGQEELIKMADQSFVIPRVAPLLEPLAMAGFMQFFVYQIAKELGCDIDKPRNLAKAVTVE